MNSSAPFVPHIRPALSGDAGFVAEMILLSMGGLGEHLFQEDGLRIVAILKQLFIRDAGRVSRKITTVAEDEVQPLGALVSCEGARLNGLNLATLPHLVRIIGIRRTARLVWMAVRLPGGREAEKDEYYISNVGVHPSVQGRGTGSRLLEFAEQTARDLSLNRCALIVGIHNRDALRLYQRRGYQVVETVRDRNEILGYHRMVKVL